MLDEAMVRLDVDKPDLAIHAALKKFLGARRRLESTHRGMYARALNDFFGWWSAQGRPPFTRATVQAWRAAPLSLKASRRPV